jgi:hypothetical protein
VSKNGFIRVSAVLALVVCGGLMLTACGGSSGASKEEIAQAEQHGREVRAEKEKERKLEREIQKLKKERLGEKKRKKEKAREKQQAPAPQTAPQSTSAPSSSTPSGTDCGEGVVAGPETSCGFAIETRNEYEREIGSGPGTVEAYSDANETWYSMTCTGAPHVCSGAISATVYFP